MASDESDAFSSAAQPHKVGTLAGFFLLCLGRPWPSYTTEFALSASYAADVATFYMLGNPNTTARSVCGEACRWLAHDKMTIAQRIRRILNISLSAQLWMSRLDCAFELKPFLPALFPELTARHQWIGYVDYDGVVGDLSSVLGALRFDTRSNVLVPERYAGVVANGNFLLYRAETALIHAFRRSPGWMLRLTTREDCFGFDEFYGRLGHHLCMSHVMQAMLRDGLLRLRFLRMLIDMDIGPPLHVPAGGRNTAVEYEVTWRPRYLGGLLGGQCKCARAAPCTTLQDTPGNASTQHRVQRFEWDYFHMMRLKHIGLERPEPTPRSVAAPQALVWASCGERGQKVRHSGRGTRMFRGGAW